MKKILQTVALLAALVAPFSAFAQQLPNGGSLTNGDLIAVNRSGVSYYTTWANPSGTGTVTSVSVSTANGVSGTVANATTTPAITLTLGAITPSSVVSNTFALSGTAYSGSTWTLSSPVFNLPAITLTDTTGSGTVAVKALNSIGAATLNSTSAQNDTVLANLYVASPVAGTNVTANDFAIYTPGYFGAVGGATIGALYETSTITALGSITSGTNGGGTTGSLILNNSAGSGAATTIVPSSGTTTAWSLTLPSSGGTSGYVLQTNGSGVTSWVAQSGGGGTVTLGTSTSATNPQRSSEAGTGFYSSASGIIDIALSGSHEFELSNSGSGGAIEIYGNNNWGIGQVAGTNGNFTFANYSNFVNVMALDYHGLIVGNDYVNTDYGFNAPSNGMLVEGAVGIGTTAPATGAKLDVRGPVKIYGYTVSTLPSGSVGEIAYVTDQTAACPAAGGALTGSGSVTCPVFYNGSAWVGM